MLFKSVAVIFLLNFARSRVNCFDEFNSTYPPRLPRPLYDTKGNVKFYPRIVGGQEAKTGEFEGIVSIQTRRGEHICGGTLIDYGNYSHILTAAHCFVEKGRKMDARRLRVVGDDLNNSVDSDNINRQIRYVKGVVIHSNYDANSLTNDIAVLILTARETDTFSAVYLPHRDVKEDEQCSTAGWGATIEKGPSSIQLLAVNLTVIPRRLCNGRNGYDGIVGRNVFCAGSINGGRDSCQGDSGGGFICNGCIAGVVSFGRGCRRFPGVYTNVYRYKKWIRSQNGAFASFKPMISLILSTVCIQFLRSILL